MANVRMSFDVYGVPDDDTGKYSEALNELVDQLATVETDLPWDNVEWVTWDDLGLKEE